MATRSPHNPRRWRASFHSLLGTNRLPARMAYGITR